jgi:MFS transporter, FHS family, L-fucose permease
VYLAVALFAFALAVLFFFSTIPEVTDADMQLQVDMTHEVEGTEKSFWKQYRLFHATFAQFCYTGAQVAVATWFINYTVEAAGRSSRTASGLLAGAQGAFTVGRFGGAAMMRFIRPRLVFFGFLSGVVLALALATGVRGVAGVAMLYLTLFFESVCFPTIVALGIRGLGRHYKRGSGFIVGGVVGGACVPALQGKVADIHDNTPLSMVVPLMFMVAALSYAVCVNFVDYYRIPADAMGDSDLGVKNTNANDDIEAKQSDSDTGKNADGAGVVEVEKMEDKQHHRHDGVVA